jgi:hypothetical protein
VLAIPSPQNRPHLVCDHPHDPEGSTTMSNIDPTIETAVLEDFRRHILGAEDSVAGAKYVYELTRLLYNEAKFPAYRARPRRRRCRVRPPNRIRPDRQSKPTLRPVTRTTVEYERIFRTTRTHNCLACDGKHPRVSGAIRNATKPLGVKPFDVASS